MVIITVSVGNSESVVTGRETFACTFEEDASCLLKNDDTNNKEMWDIDDGHGLVKDNTLNNGL